MNLNKISSVEVSVEETYEESSSEH